MCTLKVLTNLCLEKRRNKNKKCFCKYCLQGVSSEKVLVKHEDICLKINGKQTVK